MNEALTIGIPTIAVLIGILVNNSRLGDQRAHFDKRLDNLENHFGNRFDDLKDLMNAKFDRAHSELVRVEQVLDARLKHLEET